MVLDFSWQQDHFSGKMSQVGNASLFHRCFSGDLTGYQTVPLDGIDLQSAQEVYSALSTCSPNPRLLSRSLCCLVSSTESWWSKCLDIQVIPLVTFMRFTHWMRPREVILTLVLTRVSAHVFVLGKRNSLKRRGASLMSARYPYRAHRDMCEVFFRKFRGRQLLCDVMRCCKSCWLSATDEKCTGIP
ncbi:hypothetical protein F5J12DRAFT_342847 [Pisolithus orientalis]|uniref:uncharacterized protein n=1 Tax=Pisolithus orientalis TaxID=936130 RepID=UPI002224DB15|nr:uncharacterized protein F5J12DRAFT_342847 [Pisolithus orientalis]KAI5997309.1 hypothetical protein F5J12DRAFT_342847 [Pisolithus orientalis]